MENLRDGWLFPRKTLKAEKIVVLIKATSKNVIPVETGIQKHLTSLDSRLRGSDKLIIIRGNLKYYSNNRIIRKL